MAFRNAITRLSQLVADVITGALIQTAASGTRWVIDNFTTVDAFGNRDYARMRGFTGDPAEVDPGWISVYRDNTFPGVELGMTIEGPSDVVHAAVPPEGSPSITFRRLIASQRPVLEIYSLNAGTDPDLDGLIQVLASAEITLNSVINMGGTGGLEIGVVGDGLHGAKFTVPLIVTIDSNLNRTLTSEGTARIEGALEVDGLAVGTAGYTPDSYIRAPDGTIQLDALGQVSISSDNNIAETAGASLLMTAVDSALFNTTGPGASVTIDATGDVSISADDDVILTGTDDVQLVANAGTSSLVVGSDILLSPAGKIDATNETLDVTGGAIEFTGDSISKIRLLSGTVVVPGGASTADLAIAHGMGNAPTVAVACFAGTTTFYVGIASLTATNVNVRAVQRDGVAGAANIPVQVIAIWA